MRVFIVLFLAFLAMLSMGCSWLTTNIDDAAVLARLGASTAGSLAVPGTVSEDTAAKIVIVIERVEPAVADLVTADDIAGVLMPRIKIEIERVVTDPAASSVALAVVELGLNAAAKVLNSKPEYKTNRQLVCKLVDAALTGLRDGLKSKLPIGGGGE